MSKDETAALSSSTVDDISQGIDSVDISDDFSPAAVASDMNSSREEDMSSEKKCTSCVHSTRLNSPLVDDIQTAPRQGH